MNILITGSNGQLGSEFQELAKEFKQYNFFFTDIGDLDITDIEKTGKYLKTNKIEAIVNCAAFTAVDLAETQKPDAMLVNATGVKNLAQMAAKHNALLIHISTDYVFEGKNYRPYTENDTAGPKTTYGKTKLDGEIEVIFNAKRALIIRTSWLYSSFGNNFMKTIVSKCTSEEQINVVFDQIGNPTYAGDLARAILEIIPRVPAKIRTEVYNYSNEGVASWYDFAQAIVDIRKSSCKITPILTKDFPTPALRPHYTVLNKSRIKKDFNIEIPHWRTSLEKCLAKL